MTAEQLEALSKAATQGECEVMAPDTEHDFGVPLVATDYPGTFGPTNGMVLWATMQPTEIDAKDTTRAEANAAFTTALWNAYRTGQLVMVDDAAVERVAASLPRLDDGLIEAALIGHYGKGHLGIDGTSMTVRGCDWTFREGFKRMWSGVRKELKSRAAIAAMGAKP